MKINNHKSIRELVYSYPTQDKMGFTQTELDDLLINFTNINMEKFNDSLNFITCTLNENGECVIYHHDILKGLYFGLSNKQPRFLDFD
jgi:hypothetical protein